jgi:hypothetical protein
MEREHSQAASRHHDQRSPTMKPSVTPPCAASGQPRRARRSRLAAMVPVLALPALVACGDLPLLESSSSRVPSEVRIELGDPVLMVGASTVVRAVVFDQHGSPFEQLPPWSQPVWQASNAQVFRLDGSRLDALAVGESLLRVQFAGHTAALPVRVNPTGVRVSMHAYISQGVQRWDGSVPLIANRDALLRVFLAADQMNWFQPSVRARFFRDGAEVHSVVAPAKDGIPTVSIEGTLGSTYNITVPGSVLQPGTALLVETGGTAVPLLDGSVTRFPDDGEPLPLDVRAVAPFRVRFVPIAQAGTAVGNITPANAVAFMQPTRWVFPLGEVDVDIREPFASSFTTNSDQGWSQMLNEVRLLRIADGSSRYYHGIVRRMASWAGLAYVGFPVALTWDQLPEASWTVAHEFGHNFGRRHAPCGNPSGIDANFPHPGGAIGIYGVELVDQRVLPPETPDLMGYCTPRWISDYTYLNVLEFRAAGAARDAQPQPASPALLVWGSVGGPRGATLEPAFQADVPAMLPSPGPYRVEALDRQGQIVFSVPFAGDALAHGAPDERHFAMAVPLDAARAGRIARLRLTGPGVSTEASSTVGGGAARTALAIAGAPPAGTRARASRGRVSVAWDAQRFPLAVVRNARTGAILAFARNGEIELASEARELDLELSDHVGSVRRRVIVER